jgi:hypothetical protein
MRSSRCQSRLALQRAFPATEKDFLSQWQSPLRDWLTRRGQTFTLKSGYSRHHLDPPPLSGSLAILFILTFFPVPSIF